MPDYTSTYVRTDAFTCASCGLGTGPSDDVEPDDDGVPYPPRGWLRLTIEQIAPNPEYLDAVEDRKAQVDNQIQQLMAAAEEKPKAHEVAAARSMLENQLGPIDVEEFITTCAVVTLCQQHAADVEKIGVEAIKPEPTGGMT